jgi:transmembrane sensor
MNKHSDRLHYLYQRYINRTCTHEEMQELFAYVAEPEWKDQLEVIAGEHLEQVQIPDRLPEIDWEFMYQQVISPGHGTGLNGSNRRGMLRWMTGKRIAAAAIILILLSAGGYWWLVRSPKTDLATADKKRAATVDIAPGGNKAILTLADNSTVILDNAANGAIAQQGNTKVVKLDNGQLMYQSAKSNGQSAISYNILATPRGGQYMLVLPDGSKVWLNAASSITYPTAFTGKERKVKITGEAYFEVAHNSKTPFKV